MRCKTCDYPLWNLPARKCPECGSDFKPSDFHFVPNSVKFLCPHCDQQYYGTTEHGHLIPRTFSCVKCAQRIDMDEMLLMPGEGVEEARTAADVMPWLQRAHFGRFKGWMRTVGMAMAAPHKLMKAVPLEGGTGEACLFTLVTHLVITFVGVGLPLGAFALIMVLNGDRGAADMFGAAAVAIVGGTAGMVILATLWGLLTHGLLKISGGTPRGVGRTMQALYYSSGANILLGVPCIGSYCGGYFVWIWWMVSAILMVMEGQRVRGWRATLCVGAGPALAVLALAGYITFVAVTVNNMVRTIGPVAGSVIPTAEAQTVGAGILGYASQHNGQPPPHLLQLVADSQVTATNFVSWQAGHDEANVPVAGTTLSAYQFLPPNRMQIAAQNAAAALPAGVIAHRMGDVVMTCHGMNLSNANGQLWIAIIDPDPGQPSTSPLVRMAVNADGSTTLLPPTSFNAMLAVQNALRAQYQLPPLPDPATVTHAAPAVASAP